MKESHTEERLKFGNPREQRWCGQGAHYVHKLNGSYQPKTRTTQEWICNGCLARKEK